MKKLYFIALALMAIVFASCNGVSEKQKSNRFYTKEPVGDKYFVLVQKTSGDGRYDAYLCNNPDSYQDGLLLNDAVDCWVPKTENGAAEMHDGNVCYFISRAEEILFNPMIDDKLKADFMARTSVANKISGIKCDGNTVIIYTEGGKHITYTADDHKRLKEVYAKTFADGEKEIAEIEENAKIFYDNPEEEQC